MQPYSGWIIEFVRDLILFVARPHAYIFSIQYTDMCGTIYLTTFSIYICFLNVYGTCVKLYIYIAIFAHCCWRIGCSWMLPTTCGQKHPAEATPGCGSATKRESNCVDATSIGVNEMINFEMKIRCFI